MKTLALIGFLALAACSAPATTGAILATGAAVVGGQAPVILSDIAKAGCAAQAAANVAAQIAQDSGSTVWQARFIHASSAAGVACAW